MNVTTRKLLDFLNQDNNADTIDKAFEVPGRDIGEKIAQNILTKQAELREKNGYGFLTLDDVLDVKFLGDSRLEIMLSATQDGLLDKFVGPGRIPSANNHPALIESTRIAVSAAKQFQSMVFTARYTLLKAQTEAFEAQRKALELFELAGFTDNQSTPRFAQRFLKQSENFQDYYTIDDIGIVEFTQVGKQASIVFQSLSETQFYCSGVDLEITGRQVLVKFVRTHISSKKKAAISAESSDVELLRNKVSFSVPEDSTLYISDGSFSTSLKESSKKGGGSVTPGTRPPATTVATGCPFYLYIHSNVAEGVGSPGLTAGHSWLTLHDSSGAMIASYGLWPDDHPGISAAGLSNGAGSDVRTNYTGDFGVGTYYYCACITVAQRASLTAAITRSAEWTLTNTCASFASEVFEEVTGEDIDADEFLGFETPREVGESIMEANGGAATPATPPTAPAAPSGSSS